MNYPLLQMVVCFGLLALVGFTMPTMNELASKGLAHVGPMIGLLAAFLLVFGVQGCVDLNAR